MVSTADQADNRRSAAPPPYVPFRTFLTAIEGFESGLPNQVDRSVWPSHSGATQGQLLAAFRFFGLIDAGGAPTNALRELVQARETRRRNVRVLLERGYAELIALDVSKASPRQLQDAMRRYGLTGATHRKAVSFFLHAAAWSGLPLSGLLQRKTREAAPRKRKEAPPAQHGAPAAESPRESKTLRLRSGGTLTVSLDVRLTEIGKADREFLFSLLDRIRAYEDAGAEAPDENSDS